jgi:hypothetical protein
MTRAAPSTAIGTGAVRPLHATTGSDEQVTDPAQQLGAVQGTHPAHDGAGGTQRLPHEPSRPLHTPGDLVAER